MAENTGQEKPIKIVTPPDIIYDKSFKLLVVQPNSHLKLSIEDWALDQDLAISIYFFTEFDRDINWLLTTAHLSDKIVIDVDNCDDNVSQFLSYLISLPHTYYKCDHMKTPWDLLNKNRFYDFPNF
jgi:hypothetical protein